MQHYADPAQCCGMSYSRAFFASRGDAADCAPSRPLVSIHKRRGAIPGACCLCRAYSRTWRCWHNSRSHNLSLPCDRWLPAGTAPGKGQMARPGRRHAGAELHYGTVAANHGGGVVSDLLLGECNTGDTAEPAIAITVDVHLIACRHATTTCSHNGANRNCGERFENGFEHGRGPFRLGLGKQSRQNRRDAISLHHVGKDKICEHRPIACQSGAPHAQQRPRARPRL